MDSNLSFIEDYIMQNLYTMNIPYTGIYQQQMLNRQLKEKADRFFYALASIDPPNHELRIASNDLLINNKVGSLEVFQQHRQNIHRWNMGKVFDRLFDLSNTEDWEQRRPYFTMVNIYEFGSYRLAQDGECPDQDNTPLLEQDLAEDTRVTWINAGIEVDIKPKPTIVHKCGSLQTWDCLVLS